MRSFLIIASVIVFTDGREIETYLHKCQRKVLGMAGSQIQFSSWDILQDSRCAPLRHFQVCLMESESELLESGEILQELSVAARKLNCHFNEQKLTRAVSYRDFSLEDSSRILIENPFDHVRTTSECRSVLIAQVLESATRILSKEPPQLRLGSTQPDNPMSFRKIHVYDLINYKLPILGWICDLNIKQLLGKEKQESLESFKVGNNLDKSVVESFKVGDNLDGSMVESLKVGDNLDGSMVESLKVGDNLEETVVSFKIENSALSKKDKLESKYENQTDDTVPELVNRILEAFRIHGIDNVVSTIPDPWSESSRYDNTMKNDNEYMFERNKTTFIEEAISWGSGEDENDDEDSGKENEGFTSGEGQPSFDWSQDYDSESHKNYDIEGVFDYNETKNEATEEKQPFMDIIFETEQNKNVQVNPEYTPFRSWWVDGESRDIDIQPNTQGLPSRANPNRNGRIFNQVDKDDLDTDVKRFTVYLKDPAQKESDDDRRLIVESERRLAELQGENQGYHPGSVVGRKSNLVSTLHGPEGNSCTVCRMQVPVVAALVLLAVFIF